MKFEKYDNQGSTVLNRPQLAVVSNLTGIREGDLEQFICFRHGGEWTCLFLLHTVSIAFNFYFLLQGVLVLECNLSRASHHWFGIMLWTVSKVFYFHLSKLVLHGGQWACLSSMFVCTSLWNNHSRVLIFFLVATCAFHRWWYQSHCSRGGYKTAWYACTGQFGAPSRVDQRALVHSGWSGSSLAISAISCSVGQMWSLTVLSSLTLPSPNYQCAYGRELEMKLLQQRLSLFWMRCSWVWVFEAASRDEFSSNTPHNNSLWYLFVLTPLCPQALYDQIFLWLIQCINSAIRPSPDEEDKVVTSPGYQETYRNINFVDFYGFAQQEASRSVPMHGPAALSLCGSFSVVILMLMYVYASFC